MRKPNIYLVGPMGAGKTAVGRQLASKLGLQFYDSDQEIEARTGVDIPYIFEKEGEQGFRSRERDVIADLTRLTGVVIATGGGAIVDPANRVRLREAGTVVYLDTSIDQQLRRTGRSTTRPLLMTGDPRAVLTTLRSTREPLYREIADIELDTTGRRVKTVVSLLYRELKSRSLLPLQT